MTTLYSNNFDSDTVGPLLDFVQFNPYGNFAELGVCTVNPVTSPNSYGASAVYSTSFVVLTTSGGNAIAAVTELELLYDMVIPSTATYMSPVLRATADGQNFYSLLFTSGYVQLFKTVAGFGTAGIYTALTLTAGVTYSIRARVTTVGGDALLQIRVWVQGTTEPTDWVFAPTDASSPLGAGYAGFYVTGNGTVSIDDMVVTNLSVVTPTFSPWLVSRSPVLGSGVY